MMIKFFRNIRKKLLAEGSTGKYMKYALGEIVLVVIGILIALQINDGNEQRKLKIEINKFKLSLVSDLSRDTLLIGEKLNQLTNDITKLEQYFKSMSSPEVNVDSLVQIFKAFDPTIFGEISFSKNTFNSLKSTGKIKEMEDWLQKDLLELHNLQEVFYISSREDIRNYVDLYVLNNTKFIKPDLLQGGYDTEFSKRIWEDVEFDEFGGFLYKVFSVKHFVERYTVKNLEGILKQTKLLIGKLNSEQN